MPWPTVTHRPDPPTNNCRSFQLYFQIAAEVAAPLAKTDEIVLLGGADRTTSEINKLISQLPPAVSALTGVDLSGVSSQFIDCLRCSRNFVYKYRTRRFYHRLPSVGGNITKTKVTTWLCLLYETGNLSTSSGL